MKIEKILLLKLHLGIMAYHIVMNIWRLMGWIIFSFSDNDNGFQIIYSVFIIQAMDLHRSN